MKHLYENRYHDDDIPEYPTWVQAAIILLVLIAGWVVMTAALWIVMRVGGW